MAFTEAREVVIEAAPELTSVVADQLPLPSRFLLWLDGTDQCVRIQDLSAPAGRITPQPEH
jgi:hypothetical protein